MFNNSIHFRNRLQHLRACKDAKNMKLYWQLHSFYAMLARKDFLTKKVSEQHDFFD